MINAFGNILQVDNVNEALPLGMGLLRTCGVKAESRGLTTVRVPGPVSTVYANPCRRVLFDPIRDANPFFHLVESLWILSGSNRVELPQYFLKDITRFSDDHTTFHGAYGYRLRTTFGVDQIDKTVTLLREKPDTRQAVMSIWSPAGDLGAVTKDMPCNDMVMLDIVDGKLNMTVCNRSNDVVWGAYGANAVQFSILQEFIAARVGVAVGYYVQQSNNYHVYTDNLYWKESYGLVGCADPYTNGTVTTYPLAKDPEDAQNLYYDCISLTLQAENSEDLRTVEYRSDYGRNVVKPVVLAYSMYRDGLYASALSVAEGVAAEDWRLAMRQWIHRRAKRAADKKGAA